MPKSKTEPELNVGERHNEAISHVQRKPFTSREHPVSNERNRPEYSTLQILHKEALNTRARKFVRKLKKKKGIPTRCTTSSCPSFCICTYIYPPRQVASCSLRKTKRPPKTIEISTTTVPRSRYQLLRNQRKPRGRNAARHLRAICTTQMSFYENTHLISPRRVSPSLPPHILPCFMTIVSQRRMVQITFVI